MTRGLSSTLLTRSDRTVVVRGCRLVCGRRRSATCSSDPGPNSIADGRGPSASGRSPTFPCRRAGRRAAARGGLVAWAGAVCRIPSVMPRSAGSSVPTLPSRSWSASRAFVCYSCQGRGTRPCAGPPFSFSPPILGLVGDRPGAAGARRPAERSCQVRDSIANPALLGLLGSAAFGPADPASLDESRIRWLGPFAVCRRGRPFGLPTAALLRDLLGTTDDHRSAARPPSGGLSMAGTCGTSVLPDRGT
jgi:hypothetical protein